MTPIPRPSRTGPSRPRAATPAATWSRSVDLPMPGSPPSRTTEPATSPPPRTRSSSPMPTGRRSVVSPGAGGGQRHGRCAGAREGRRGGARTRLVADDGLDQGVPLAARAALALPPEDGGAAGLADEPALGAGHGRAPGRRQASTGVFASVASMLRPLPSGFASTTIVSPWLYRPSSRCSASGSSIRFWIVAAERAGAVRRRRSPA